MIVPTGGDIDASLRSLRIQFNDIDGVGVQQGRTVQIDRGKVLISVRQLLELKNGRNMHGCPGADGLNPYGWSEWVHNNLIVGLKQATFCVRCAVNPDRTKDIRARKDRKSTMSKTFGAFRTAWGRYTDETKRQIAEFVIAEIRKEQSTMTWADGLDTGDFKLHSFTTGKDGETTSEKHVRKGRAESEVVHVPDPAFVSKTSTLYDKDGEVAAQWVMQRPEDKQRQETFEVWADAAMKDFPARPLVPLSPHFAHTDDHLLVSYPIGDHHIGMLAWKHEVGVSNDIELAEALLSDAMSYLVAGSPVASYGLVAVLGDFFHYDSFDSVTPTNRNLLDSDGRAPKMIDAGFRLIEQVIDFALQKHTNVHVMVELGNHDKYTSMILARYIARVFRDNPRVTVDINPSHFHYYEWGSCLFGTTHGDARAAKPANLPGIMAVDQREAWGRTKHRYWMTGHIHQQKVYEFPGCTIESFPILPPGDAYSYNEGYRSKREMKAITYHCDHGEVGRQVVNPEMLK